MEAALRDAGCEILNDVVINQVLVSFCSPELTRRVIAGIQQDGTCWCGGTVWQGRTAASHSTVRQGRRPVEDSMRISVSSWATTDDDVEKSLEAILRIAAQVKAVAWQTAPAEMREPHLLRG
jgi:hypothetical protein